MPLTKDQIRLRDAIQIYMPTSTRDWWRPVFVEGHEHNLHPSKDKIGDIVYRVPGKNGGKDKHVRTTIAKYMTKNFKAKYNFNMHYGWEPYIAKVVDAMKPPPTKEDLDKEFKLVTGQDITDAYRAGVGINSCMCGDIPQNKFYGMWPGKLFLLIWKERTARCLVWKDDSGKLVMDKLYSGDPGAAARYSLWAILNEAVNVRMDSTPRLVTLGPTALDDKLSYPYFDSFQYVSDKGVFCNAKQADSVWHLHNTGGLKIYIGPHCHHCHKQESTNKDYKQIGTCKICKECQKKDLFFCACCGTLREKKHEHDGTIYDGWHKCCFECAKRNRFVIQCDLCAGYYNLCVEVPKCPCQSRVDSGAAHALQEALSF